MEKKKREYGKQVITLALCILFIAGLILGAAGIIPTAGKQPTVGKQPTEEMVPAAGYILAGQEEDKEKNSTNIQLYARSAVLMDADSGRVLFGKNENERMPMASTTKIMTCILALENGNMEDMVTVSSYAAGQPKVHLGMREGQQFRLKDLLYSLMLERSEEHTSELQSQR